MENYHDISFALYEHSKNVEERFLFSGNIDDSITSQLLQLSESEMENKGEKLKVKKRVFYVLVESLQNITRHKERVSEDSGSLMVVQKYRGAYQVITGNMVKTETKSWLEDKLNSINTLDSDGLKSVYYELLNNGSISSKGGAGLGLIEMARKTKNRIGFEFVDHVDGYCYFYMQMSLGQVPEEDEQTQFLFKNIVQYHQMMRDRQVDLIFQNRFNQQSVLNLLKLTKGAIREGENRGIRKRINGVMVELLQNVTKHGTAIEEEDGNLGCLCMGRGTDGRTLLSCSNIINDESERKLKSQLEQVNEHDLDELNDMYNDVLVHDKTTAISTGLGFIDMRIKTKEKLNYFFKRLDSDKQFFTLEARI